MKKKKKRILYNILLTSLLVVIPYNKFLQLCRRCIVALYTFNLKMLFNFISYTVSIDRIIMNDEWLKIWNEAVVTYLKLLTQHLTPETKENHKSQSRYSWCSGRDSNPGSPKYRAGVLIT
jgi:hypothetical protein